MTFDIKSTLAVGITGLLLSMGSVQAQESDAAEAPAMDPNTVLATVNGTEITLAHVIVARSNLPQQYAQLPAALLFDGLLDQLVQQTLLDQSFDGEMSLQSKSILENENRAVRAGEAISALLDGQLDEAELKEAYEAQYPEIKDELEYRAAHILVETEDEAKDIISELEGGAQFSALANERSTGPSASVGGDLGWFGDGDMVQPFFEAVIALEPGGVSGPVETQFGWHVVTLMETRAVERPAFDTVREELENQLQQSVLEDHIASLTETAEIDRADTSEMDPEVISQFELLEN